MNYGRAIRLVRSTRGLSQKALAKKLDVDPSLISHLEKNARQPSAETLQQLSQAFDLPLYLFVFLASDEKDLQGLPPQQAQLFGGELLRLLAGGAVTKKPKKK
jgi:transcriptional regulator with XRE-family HTH domain